MNRRAVNKYGSSFVNNLNARGKVQGLSAGGEPGSAPRANKGSSRWIDSGKAYQSMPMSGFFYSGEAQSVALAEDIDAASAMRAEREEKAGGYKKNEKEGFKESIAWHCFIYWFKYGS